MLKDKRNMWNWRGNELDFVRWPNFVFLVGGFILVLVIFLMKNKLQARFKRGGKFAYIFKSDMAMWQTIGIVGLVALGIRMVLIWTYSYTLYWEGLGLHMCRSIITVIFLFLAFRKIELVKYVSTLGIIGFILGLWFNGIHSEIVSSARNAKGFPIGYKAIGHQPTSVKDLFNVHSYTHNNGVYTPSQRERLMLSDGDKFLNLGPDSVFYYDSFAAHYVILLFPIFIWTAYGLKMDAKHFHRMQISIISFIVVIWSVNIFTNFSPDPHWRSNYWYFGMDANNEQSSAWGSLNGWPQNLFSYTGIGFLMTIAMQFVYVFQDKIVFQKEKKFIKLIPSKNWVMFKEGYSKGLKSLIKDIFTRDKKLSSPPQ